jgi:hypothetical protein
VTAALDRSEAVRLALSRRLLSRPSSKPSDGLEPSTPSRTSRTPSPTTTAYTRAPSRRSRRPRTGSTAGCRPPLPARPCSCSQKDAQHPRRRATRPRGRASQARARVSAASTSRRRLRGRRSQPGPRPRPHVSRGRTGLLRSTRFSTVASVSKSSPRVDAQKLQLELQRLGRRPVACSAEACASCPPFSQPRLRVVMRQSASPAPRPIG